MQTEFLLLNLNEICLESIKYKVFVEAFFYIYFPIACKAGGKTHTYCTTTQTLQKNMTKNTNFEDWQTGTKSLVLMRISHRLSLSPSDCGNLYPTVYKPAIIHRWHLLWIGDLLYEIYLSWYYAYICSQHHSTITAPNQFPSLWLSYFSHINLDLRPANLLN